MPLLDTSWLASVDQSRERLRSELANPPSGDAELIDAVVAERGWRATHPLVLGVLDRAVLAVRRLRRGDQAHLSLHDLAVLRRWGAEPDFWRYACGVLEWIGRYGDLPARRYSSEDINFVAALARSPKISELLDDATPATIADPALLSGPEGVVLDAGRGPLEGVAASNDILEPDATGHLSYVAGDLVGAPGGPARLVVGDAPDSEVVGRLEAGGRGSRLTWADSADGLDIGAGILVVGSLRARWFGPPSPALPEIFVLVAGDDAFAAAGLAGGPSVEIENGWAAGIGAVHHAEMDPADALRAVFGHHGHSTEQARIAQVAPAEADVHIAASGTYAGRFLKEAVVAGQLGLSSSWSISDADPSDTVGMAIRQLPSAATVEAAQALVAVGSAWPLALQAAVGGLAGEVAVLAEPGSVDAVVAAARNSGVRWETGGHSVWYDREASMRSDLPRPAPEVVNLAARRPDGVVASDYRWARLMQGRSNAGGILDASGRSLLRAEAMRVGVDLDLWAVARGSDPPEESLGELMPLLGDRLGWNALDPDVAAVAAAVFAGAVEALAGRGSIPEAALDELTSMAERPGFWAELANGALLTDPQGLRFPFPDPAISVLRAAVATGGEARAMADDLGPLQTILLRSLVGGAA